MKAARTDGPGWPWPPGGCLSTAPKTLGCQAFLPVEKSIFHSQMFMAENRIPASKIVVAQGLLPSSIPSSSILLMEDQERAKEIYLYHQRCDQ